MQQLPVDGGHIADGHTLSAARPADTREIAELWCDAFPGPRSVEERMRMLQSGGRYGGLETVLVVRNAATELVAAAKLYRLEGHIAGAAFPLMGLAAVAVAPSHRRKGLGARLCTEALATAARRGDLLSALYPFHPAYYRKLGWGQVGELHDYRFHTSALPRYPEARHVRPAEGPADGAAIAASYSRVVAGSNGPITRDRRVWAYRLAAQELGVKPIDDDAGWIPPVDPKLRVVVHDDGGVRGYALLRYVTRRDRTKQVLEVRELVAEAESAYRGLLGYLSMQSDRWPLARHFARPEERFGDRLSDPRPPGHQNARSLYFPTARIVHGPMLRLLDVPGALARRPWFDAAGAGGGGPTSEAGQPSAAASDRAATSNRGAGALRIAVRDAQLPSNSGSWVVRLNGPGPAAVDVDGGGPCEAAISTDASTLARVFAGDIAPTAAARLGLAEVRGDAALLDAAFATRERFWLLDEF